MSSNCFLGPPTRANAIGFQSIRLLIFSLKLSSLSLALTPRRIIPCTLPTKNCFSYWLQLDAWSARTLRFTCQKHILESAHRHDQSVLPYPEVLVPPVPSLPLPRSSSFGVYLISFRFLPTSVSFVFFPFQAILTSSKMNSLFMSAFPWLILCLALNVK